MKKNIGYIRSQNFVQFYSAVIVETSSFANDTIKTTIFFLKTNI